MAFVIRADDDGRISWITPANEQGFRGLSDRPNAAVFTTLAEAEQVAKQLAPAYARSGVRLSIEIAE